MKQGNPSRLSKWYPIGFAIAAIVFFIIGGALLGTYFGSGYSSCSSDYYFYNDYYNYDSGSCFDGNHGEFYGGIAMLVLGGICKFIAWVLFIIWCVKRNRYNQTNITYVNNAPPAVESYPQQQQYAAPQPTYPMQQGAQFPTRSPGPASPGPMYPEGAHSAAGTPPPKDPMATATAFKYCPQCGTAANGRFCSQCGVAC